MKKLLFSILPLVLVLSACFESAQATPPASRLTMPSTGDIAEGDLVISRQQQVPHDVIALKVPSVNFLFRVSDVGGAMGNWSDSSALNVELLRGKTLQIAVTATDYGKVSELSLEFETYWDRYFATKIRAREQWGAKTAKPDMDIDAWKKIFAVHHTAGQARSDDAAVKGIQVYHMDTRKWSDVGYHFLIGTDGTIFEGRELGYVGAHVYRHNRESIGLNFLGCYDSVECHGPTYPEVSEVTEKMVDAMGELIGVLSVHYGIDVNELTVKGHKEFSGTATACPGDRVMARMEDIRMIALATHEAIKQKIANNRHNEL